MPAEQNLLGSNTGGASESAPRVTPVFSFRTSGGGDIYVYLAKTEIMKVALITYDDTSSEYVYATLTLTSSWESEHLVSNAAQNFPFSEDNPFIELEKNEEAMQKLGDLLAQFFYSGE